MQPKLITKFSILSEPNFLARSEAIAASLANNAAFPTPWPAEVPSVVVLTTDVTTYKNAFTAASGGDRTKIKIRQGARLVVTTDLQIIASYLEIVAGNNVALLQSTGYDLRRDVVRSLSRDPPDAPQGLSLTRGMLSGVLALHAQPVPGVDVYTVQYTSGDPSAEANWIDAGIFKHCTHIKLTGLAPLKTYYVRIRSFNKNGHGPWAMAGGVLVA